MGRRITVRALVLSDLPLADRPPDFCLCRADAGPWTPMTAIGPRSYAAALPWPEGSRSVSVRAAHPRWPGYGPDDVDTDVIEPAGRTFVTPQMPAVPGSDAFRIGAWLQKGIRGDQLGPNRNGRPW